jgi:hypothetical protein
MLSSEEPKRKELTDEAVLQMYKKKQGKNTSN